MLALAKFEDEHLLDELSKLGVPTIAVVFGSPYRLAKIPLFQVILIAYENEREAQDAAADVLLGQLVPKGKLPVSVKLNYYSQGTSKDELSK